MKKILFILLFTITSIFASQQKMPPIPVKVFNIDNKGVKITKKYPATIKASSSVNIIARVGGSLEKKYFNEGDFVKKGQKLYKIEQNSYKATLNKAKASLSQANAALSKASKDWSRYKKLYASHSVSASTKDQYEFNYKNARANVENAKASLESAQIQYNYTIISAPNSGIVGMTKIDVGNIVSPNNILTTITKTNPVYVEFSLPQQDINKYLNIIKHSDVTFSINSNGKTVSGGKLNYVSSILDNSTDSLTIRTTFPNPNSDIIIGQFTTLSIGNISLKNSFVIPEQAILQNGGMSLVYVVQNNIAVPRPVRVGGSTDGGIIVNGGLKNGEKIIISNMAKVRPKSKVQIIKGKK